MSEIDQLRAELAAALDNKRYGWDAARAADREYQRIHALLVEALDSLNLIQDAARRAILALDISTKLPPK